MSFKPAPSISPLLNLGCLFDVRSGRVMKGQFGENIINGGLNYITGIGGRGNMFKSVLAHWMCLTAVSRYGLIKDLELLAEEMVQFILYDTEGPVNYARLEQLSAKMYRLGGIDLEMSGLMILTNMASMSGNEYFKALQDMVNEKKKSPKLYTVTTPFMDRRGSLIKTLRPTVSEIDSFSMLLTDTILKLYEDKEIGDSSLNTDSLRNLRDKSSMMLQWPGLTSSTNLYLVTTAHQGDKHDLDPRSPKPKALSFMKQHTGFKFVPQQYYMLTNNLWSVQSCTVFQNDTTKGANYPRLPGEEYRGDVDLQKLAIQNLRAKSGPTGSPFEIIISQKEGVLVPLSELNYLRTLKYGLQDNNIKYELDLYPGVEMRRTTARKLMDEDPLLCRALELTTQLYDVSTLMREEYIHIMCTPAELRADLEAKGYNWNILLDTRGWWAFEEDEHPQEYLSIIDLLEMRAGNYHPYWLDKTDFTKVIGHPDRRGKKVTTKSSKTDVT